MAAPGQWLAGMRPRTLSAAVVPVLVGTALAVAEQPDGSGGEKSWTGDLSASRFVLTLLLALLLQVGVNYANDYSDGIKGSDKNRQGPARLVASGAAKPIQVLLAAWLCFLGAAVAGLVLSFWAGWELIPVGAAAIVAAWFYTGGPRPYGYYALGELFVFIFFGLVATAGTVYIQTSQITGRAIIAGAGVGFVACALLVANNLRDLKSDEAARKYTLAVVLTRRFSEIWARRVYLACWLGAAIAVVALAVGDFSRLWALFGLAAVALAIRPILVVLQAAPDDGGKIFAVLAVTGKLFLVYGLTLSAGLWLTALTS